MCAITFSIFYYLVIYLPKEKEAIKVIEQAKQEEQTDRTIKEKTKQRLASEDVFNKAMALWKTGECADPNEAIIYLNEAIRLRPDYSDAYFRRGLAYASLGNHQQAIMDYTQAIVHEPNLPGVYYYRGHSFSDLGQKQRAIDDYTKAISLKQDFIYAYFSRGATYQNLKQYQQAIMDFDKVIALEPNLADAYKNRASSYLKIYQFQRAIESYDHFIRLRPNDASGYTGRGFAYLLLDDSSLRACNDYEKACSMGDCKSYNSAKESKVCR